MEVFAFLVLQNTQYMTAGGGYSTLEEALKGVESHFRSDPNVPGIGKHFQQDQGIAFRVFRSDGAPDPWDSRIVEVGPDDARPMTVLATYKIIRGQMADKPTPGPS